MKISSPTAPKPPEPLSILLIGPPGGGKTTLMLQFPDVEVEDCDRNLDGPERFLRTKLKSLAYSYNCITYTDDGKPVPLHLCYDRLLDKLKEARTTPSKTVGGDSLSLMNEFIVRKVLGDQFRPTIEIRDWMKIKSNYMDLLVANLRSLGKTVIITAHEKVAKKTDPTNPMLEIITGYEPNVQGSIADVLPGLFTDIWRCTSRPGPGQRTEYVIHTAATALSPYLKNSLGLPSEIIIANGELAFDKLKPFLNGKV